MAKIKIKDLPKNKKISEKDMKNIAGGFNPQPEPPARWWLNTRSSFFDITTVDVNEL